MVFNTTFNNISDKWWRSVLLVEEAGVTGENHQPHASHWQTLSHNVVSSIPRPRGVRTVVKGTNCIGSYKFNYHTITTKTAPRILQEQCLTKNCKENFRLGLKIRVSRYFLFGPDNKCLHIPECGNNFFIFCIDILYCQFQWR
jgi:hypothetical protein